MYSEAERGIVGRDVIYSRVWYRWTSLQSPLVEGTEIFMDSHELGWFALGENLSYEFTLIVVLVRPPVGKEKNRL